MTTNTTFGQTDALALAVVTWLNQNSATFCVPIAAERRFRLSTELDDIPTAAESASVDVFPDIENSERQGMSKAFSSSYVIHIYIQQQVTGATGETDEQRCELLARLRSEIIEALKLRLFTLSNAVHPVPNVFLAEVKNGDKGLYGLPRLMQLNVFESDTILVFRASV